MTSANKKKDSERLSVMVPRDCKDDIEYIIAQTGIKSNGELFRLLLARYKHDFCNSYNQFFTPSNIPVNNQVTTSEQSHTVTSSEPKPLTSAMSF
ncbi:hypothetical protein NIES4101_33920 [Calothrix sp. NIES-4101]|nr:hypothetical protein NIES4101_33920 [Calothrix sp. NIES-4101]